MDPSTDWETAYRQMALAVRRWKSITIGLLLGLLYAGLAERLGWW